MRLIYSDSDSDFDFDFDWDLDRLVWDRVVSIFPFFCSFTRLEVHSLLVDNFAAPEGERSMKIRQTLKIHLTGLEYEVLAALMYLLHEVQLCEEHVRITIEIGIEIQS